MTVGRQLCLAAKVLAANGLVDAFGHVSARVGDTASITPAVPLGFLSDPGELVDLPLVGAELPSGAPREAWIHREIYAARPDAGAVCRAQPAAVAAAAAAGLPILPLSGQGAMLGSSVPAYDSAELVRDRDRGAALALSLGDAAAVALRGNGAVTVGGSVGEAVVRMYLLEASARLNLAAAAAGTPRPAGAEEISAWGVVAPELSARLWSYLVALVEQGQTELAR